MSPRGWCTCCGSCLKAGVGGWGALGALVLLEHFACSLAVQQCLSRARCSRWLSSRVPVTAAGVRREFKEWGTAHSCGAVSFPAQTQHHLSVVPHGPANPPCSKESWDLIKSFADCFLWIQRVIHTRGIGSRRAGAEPGSRCSVVRGTGQLPLCSALFL